METEYRNMKYGLGDNEALQESYSVLKQGIRNGDTRSIIIGIVVGTLIFAYYIKRGLELVLPALFGATLIALLSWSIGTLLWEIVTSPPTIPPDVMLVAAAVLIGLPALALVGYYNDRYGWADPDQPGGNL